MKVYAVVFTDAYEGEPLVECLYTNSGAANTHAEELRLKYPWMATRYQVEEREVLSERRNPDPVDPAAL